MCPGFAWTDLSGVCVHIGGGVVMMEAISALTVSYRGGGGNPKIEDSCANGMHQWGAWLLGLSSCSVPEGYQPTTFSVFNTAGRVGHGGQFNRCHSWELYE